MKKILFVIVLFALAINNLNAQTKIDTQTAAAIDNKPHKIVFQLTSDDTLVHKALMKQLNNVLTVAPASTIEVVCQGPGLSILMQNKTLVQEKIHHLKKKNIEFVACEFSMIQMKITKEMMIPEAGFVKYGILEIVDKQEQGWSYIRSGF